MKQFKSVAYADIPESTALIIEAAERIGNEMVDGDGSVETVQAALDELQEQINSIRWYVEHAE